MPDLRVSPGAKETSVAGIYGERAIKPKVAAPSVEGRPNAGVERFLARLLGVYFSRISFFRGAWGRDKFVFVRVEEPREVRESPVDLLVRV